MVAQSKTATQAKTVAPGKTRSPRYPAISFPDALTRVRAVYDKAYQHTVPRDAIAKALGYTSLNGTSITLISALIKYGLLEQAGEQLRVTDNALTALFHEADHPERLHAIREMAFAPAIFADLRATYGEKVPSNDIVTVYLIRKGFSPRSASEVIRSYRDTVGFVNDVEATAQAISDAQPVASSSPDPAFEESWDDMVTPTQATQRTANQQLAATPLRPAGTGATQDQGHKSLTIPVATDKFAVLQAEFPLTEEEWAQLEATVEVMKRVLTKKPTVPQDQPASYMDEQAVTSGSASPNASQQPSEQSPDALPA